MNIGFYLPKLAGGGAEILSVRIANELASRGHIVHLLADKGQACDASQFGLQVPLHVLGGTSLLSAASALARRSRDLEIDTLFSVLPVANLIADLSVVRFRQRAKVINTWHGYWGSRQGIKGSIAHLGVSVLTRICATNVAVSNDLARHLRAFGAPARSIKVIYNGIVLPSPVAPYRHERPYVFSAGSLTKHKNHELLIRAFEKVRRQRDWDLIVAGQGPERDRLAELTATLGLQDHVHFIGFQRDLSQYYSGAALFALPSNVETFGVVLVEALACGTPVVSTDSGGPSEVLSGGKFGALVPVGNIDAMAAAMVAHSQSHPAPEILKARAAEFEISRVADAYSELCQSVHKSA